jgi:hypothetical protein
MTCLMRRRSLAQLGQSQSAKPGLGTLAGRVQDPTRPEQAETSPDLVLCRAQPQSGLRLAELLLMSRVMQPQTVPAQRPLDLWSAAVLA